jgi:hypothetical protein
MIKTALGLSTAPKKPTKTWEGLFASRLVIYIALILVAALASYAYQVRTRTIFSCPANGYSTDRYMAYCHGANYADYEHGAFQFDLEPSALNFAKKADVLFLGNSRLQVAFSTAATADWFSAASTRYYLMGFGYFENMIFAEELLRKTRPRADVYVINIDDFFDRSETMPVKAILHDPDARNRYEMKRFWQRVHEPICKTLTVFCGHKFVVFRSYETGAYYTEGAAQQKITPVSYDQVVDQSAVDSNTAAAIDFLGQYTQGKCVIFTVVPLVGTKIGNASAIAHRLGVDLMTPALLEGLQTYDGYHLDQSSAARWSQAFFQAAGSRIRSCLEERRAAHPSGSSL